MLFRTLIVALALVAAPGLAQAPAGPMLHPDEIKAVSAHVQVIPDGSRPLVPNVGIVVGRTGVLVVDTGLGPENGALAYAAAVKAAPGRKVYLVATHAHPEHDLGAQAFPAGTVMLRSKAQEADIADQGLRLAEIFSRMSPRNAELLKDAKFRAADVSFDKGYDLDLGGLSAHLEALGPAHTAGDIAIWIARDRVLFAGDLAMKAQPAITSAKATPATWRAALARQAAWKPGVVVPSHGPIGDAGFIVGYRAYLGEVADRVAKAKAAGQDYAAASAQIAEAMSARYPDKGRLMGAVKMAWDAGS